MSINTVLSKCNYTGDIVKLELLESHCLPIILYAIESLDVKSSQVTEINTWWNSVYRKIFGYNKWESVKELICLLGRLDIHHLVNMRRLLFIKRLQDNDNAVMMDLMYKYRYLFIRIKQVTKITNKQSKGKQININDIE